MSTEIPDDNRREMMLLSSAYRAMHSRGDRLKDEKRLGSQTDPFTGLPTTEAALKAPGEALVGPAYAKARWLQPEELALTHNARVEKDGSVVFLANVRCWAVVWDVLDPDPKHAAVGLRDEVEVKRYPIHERSSAESEVLYLEKRARDSEGREGINPKVVERRGRAALTEEEARETAFLKDAFERTLLSMAERGWVVLKPPQPFESPGEARMGNDAYKRGVADSGEVFVAGWTSEGLAVAERVCSGDPYWGQVGAFSSLEGADPAVKARAVETSPWAHKKYLEEGGR